MEIKIINSLVRVPLKLTIGVYLLKVNNGNTRTICEICSKLTMKRPKRKPLRGRLQTSLLVLSKFENLLFSYNFRGNRN